MLKKFKFFLKETNKKKWNMNLEGKKLNKIKFWTKKLIFSKKTLEGPKFYH